MHSSVDDETTNSAKVVTDASVHEPSRESHTETLELSIVMPCLNESETLETCIRKAQGFLAEHDIRGEVVVGDNGSSDGSQEIAKGCGARVVNVPIHGYGAAVYQATLSARGEYVIMGDSDDSYDFSELARFVEELRGGADLVMGDRFQGGIKPMAMPWKNRWIGNPALSAIGRLFFHCPIGDFHCGLRGYSRAAFKRMRLQTTGMEFASEMVIKATLLGMLIREIPTTLSPDGRSRPPHLRPWRDGWRHLRFMLLYAPSWLFLYPGLILMALGIAVTAWLLPQPREVRLGVLDVHTLLYASGSILVGFQAVAFAAFSRLFSTADGLVAEDSPLSRLFHGLPLEAGLLTGFALIAMGLCGAGSTIAWWAWQSFGPLDASTTLRVAIPSTIAIAMGVQLVQASFFLGVLRLRLPSLSEQV